MEGLDLLALFADSLKKASPTTIEMLSLPKMRLFDGSSQIDATGVCMRGAVQHQ